MKAIIDLIKIEGTLIHTKAVVMFVYLDKTTHLIKQ